VSRASRLLFWCLGFVLAGSFYLLLIDTADSPELYAGTGAVALAALGFEAVREQGFAEVGFSPRWLARAWRLLARIPADAMWVSLTALQQLVAPRRRRGVLRAFKFEHGAAQGPLDAGRRALAESAGSLAPNTIVIGIDPERDLILAHQLRCRGGVDDVDVLGLR